MIQVLARRVIANDSETSSVAARGAIELLATADINIVIVWPWRLQHPSDLGVLASRTIVAEFAYKLIGPSEVVKAAYRVESWLDRIRKAGPDGTEHSWPAASELTRRATSTGAEVALVTQRGAFGTGQSEGISEPP